MRSSLALLLILSVEPVIFAADWPAFRGPKGNGVSDEKQAPLEWNKDNNVKWTAALPQPGNGSPIVSNGKVFVTCAEDTKGHQRSLYCFDRKTGEKVWVKTVEYAKDEPTHETNMYCGTTPAADGRRVVVWHSSAGLYCYDFAGKELWKKDLGEFQHMWGYGSSPVIHDDRVILNSGPGKKEIFVAAFALADGKQLWRTDEPFQGDGEYRAKEGAYDKAYMGSWTTPLVATIDGKEQAICTMPKRVVSYDLNDGKILWYCEGIRAKNGDLAYSSPSLDGDVCVVTGGFGGPALAVKVEGEGNITDKQRLWRRESNPQSIGSGVIVDGYLYRPNAGPGTIECIDPQTGKTLWDERAGTYWGSITYVAGRCYAPGQDGVMLVFKPSPKKFDLLAKNSLGEGTNSTPAISDGEFFIRTLKSLYCIGQ
jgi:outer membrane protein assembly factor BamB